MNHTATGVGVLYNIPIYITQDQNFHPHIKSNSHSTPPHPKLPTVIIKLVTMASNHQHPANTHDMSAQIIIGCSRDVAERISILVSPLNIHTPCCHTSRFKYIPSQHSQPFLQKTPTNIPPQTQPVNQTLHLASLPPSFSSNPKTTDTPGTIFFALPPHPLHPPLGYVFSRTSTTADFQLPHEMPLTTSPKSEFRLVLNKALEWTLVDESLTGVSVNNMKLSSRENQKLRKAAGCFAENQRSEMALLPGRGNLVKVGWNGLGFTIFVLGDEERVGQGVGTWDVSASGWGKGDGGWEWERGCEKGGV